LKIAIGYKLKDSSWGGGNQFVNYLVNAAKEKNHKVVFNLNDADIDIILMVDPRTYNEDITFGSLEILFYLLFVNKNAIAVHRINECDERKKTKHMNFLLRLSNYSVDYTIFISEWLKKLSIYEKNKSSSVILNGGDSSIFKSRPNFSWDGSSPLKIVTHHWSSNLMKGFDVYKEIDNLLTKPEWERKIEFTYIGNLPKGFKFKKSKHLGPINGKKLGNELAKHHIYISASINEPAGMHHIEGILCGLPIIFRNSGALPEYCFKYGISFENSNFLPALKKMMGKYSFYKKIISQYPNNSLKMTDEYLNLFSTLIKERSSILKNRNLFRSPLLLIMNIIFIFMKLKNIIKYYLKFFTRKFK
tara:strand:+ start:1264 stop:2343 length:1080 start_codon:yes stop_codon:yes gene_type:complete